MNNNFALNLPFNATSFGQLSYSITLEIFKRGLNPVIFPIQKNADFSTQRPSKEFQEWIIPKLQKCQEQHDRNFPLFKLWHILDSLESYSKEQSLLTFHELDNITPVEKNILKNQSKVLVTSNYTKDVFESAGIPNVGFVPLFFDQNYFKRVQVRYPDERITWGLCGKLEHRKHHVKVLKAWAKQYGDKHGHYLNCSIWNNFLDKNQQTAIIAEALGGRKYWNINFNLWAQTNDAYNHFLNSNDIILGMSGGEGWGLGEFHSVALGKHCVGLNAHAHKEWMNPENTVLVNPSDKIDVYDGIFFQKGLAINQGQIFDFDESDFLEACKVVEERLRLSKVNAEGLKLQDKFTVQNTTDLILESIK